MLSVCVCCLFFGDLSCLFHCHGEVQLLFGEVMFSCVWLARLTPYLYKTNIYIYLSCKKTSAAVWVAKSVCINVDFEPIRGKHSRADAFYFQLSRAIPTAQYFDGRINASNVNMMIIYELDRAVCGFCGLSSVHKLTAYGVMRTTFCTHSTTVRIPNWWVSAYCLAPQVYTSIYVRCALVLRLVSLTALVRLRDWKINSPNQADRVSHIHIYCAQSDWQHTRKEHITKS